MMNKKGIGLPSVFTIFILVLVVVVLAAAQRGVDASTINKTIETLNWSRTGANVTNSLHQSGEQASEYYIQVLFFSIEKAVDFMGYTTFAVAKIAMSLARDNPNIINYKVLLLIILVVLLAPGLYYGFMGMIVVILLINEWRKNKKEKKYLDSMKKEVQK